MKDKMIGFYKPTEEAFKDIWSNATFVVDANVLLNLYRYPVKARDELLGAFKKLAERLWLPYHAALEFQRNRLGVIADQKRKFYDVRKVVGDAQTSLANHLNNLQLKKRHSSIDVDEYIAGFESLTKGFMEQLAKLEESQKKVSDDDELRATIDAIFLNKVGSLIWTAKELEDLYKEGEQRYQYGTPPGYMDASKEKSKDTESFQYGGLTYKRKFGDLILWKQMLAHAKAEGLKNLVFITDDEKEDWWWIVDSQGAKKVGPRPELVEEVHREAGGANFYMYNSEQFLELSKKYLEAEISDESITQIRDVKNTSLHPFPALMQFGTRVEKAVFGWLNSVYPNAHSVAQMVGGDIDLIFVDGDTNRRIGFCVKYIKDIMSLLPHLKEMLFRLSFEGSSDGLEEVTLVLATENEELLGGTINFLKSLLDAPSDVYVVVGRLSCLADPNGSTFTPISGYANGREMRLK